jgi:hypothetical protein
MAQPLTKSTGDEEYGRSVERSPWTGAAYHRAGAVSKGGNPPGKMVTDGPEQIDENDLRLMAPREWLRDRRPALLKWVREKGRM